MLFTPRLLIVAIVTLVLVTLFAILGFAQQVKPESSAQQQRQNQPTVEKVQQNDRSLTVQHVNTGAALDGRGKLWAVVIGVSNYKNLSPDNQLKFAHRDAEDVAAFLRSPAGGGFPSTQIKLLLNQEATLAEMRTALGTWLARSAEANDVVHIFFAGHGVVEGANDGYLLAHDSDPQNLYATALSIAELDRILTERIRARVVVVTADACHSGKLGLTARGAAEQLLINRYLAEVGKSGAGTFRLLASRADERSYEDQRWGGGHGVFTHFLLEGLKGRADRDKDNVVRAGELLDFISEIVPAETNALQHPRAAGNIDVRLPLAILSTQPATQPAMVSLEVRGAPASEVYLNNSYRGRIRPNGLLVIEGLDRGGYEISIDPPGAETLNQTISLSAARTVLDLKAAMPAGAAIKSSPMVGQVKQALTQGKIMEDEGAWALYRQLIEQIPAEPQRAALEMALISALEEIGQQSINNYVKTSDSPLSRDQLQRAAEAYTALKELRPNDPQVQAKLLFSQARVLIAEGRAKEAIPLLELSIRLDPRTACSVNALGLAYEKSDNHSKALEYFQRAAALAPNWSLPRFNLGHQYYLRGWLDRAEREWRASLELDPYYSSPRLWLVRVQRERSRRYRW